MLSSLSPSLAPKIRFLFRFGDIGNRAGRTAFTISARSKSITMTRFVSSFHRQKQQMHDTNSSAVVIRTIKVNATQADWNVNALEVRQPPIDLRFVTKILDEGQHCPLGHHRVAVRRQRDHEKSSSSTLHPQRAARVTSAPPQLFT
ncbi:MAG: hypothetical protein L6R36_008880 [Xanthoria steineri]|nr:MAG: hypothetical protein L6R36_008880 [Xanthoria steineri]